MRRIVVVGLGLGLLASPALAVDKGANAGTLAREATPARKARLAEIAKDASPPKTTSRKLYDYRQDDPRDPGFRVRFGK